MVPRAGSTGGPAPARAIEPPADAAPADALPVDDPERYEQVAEHARGGLGRVVRAVDRRLGRTVAVKELLRRDDAHEARFMREALITARLQHPGIVPVHEAGRWPNGDPYYVMKLVQGRTLKDLLAAEPTLRGRLGLLPHVIAVADAVGYAHSEGVIHRDLKPSNVVVGAFGDTVVVDWGLARDRRCDAAEASGGVAATDPRETLSGKVVGTPGYMAPEQARGDEVDERADVYALGAVLYELLAGAAPHHADSAEAVLDKVLAGPPPRLAKAAPGAPEELITIAEAAMARAPATRYRNATALAEDLRRYQTGQLVSVQAYSTWSLIRRKVARNRGVVAVAAAGLLVLGAVGVASVGRVVAERNNARVERGRAEEAVAAGEQRQRELVLLQAETSLGKDPTATLAWLKLAPAATAAVSPGVIDAIDEALALGVARHVIRLGDWVYEAVFTPDGHHVVAAIRDGRIVVIPLDQPGPPRLLGRTAMPEALVLTADGQTAITGDSLGNVQAWPVAGGAPRQLMAGQGQAVSELALSADGASVLVGHEGRSSEIVPLDGGAASSLGLPGVVRVTAAPEAWGVRVAQTGPNQVAVVTPTGLRPLATIDKVISWVAMSPRGDRVFLKDETTLWMVPLAGGAPRALTPYAGRLRAVVESPDHGSVAVVGDHVDVLMIRYDTGAVRALRGHTDATYEATFTADGRRLLTASDDGTARLWDVATGAAAVLRGHDDDVYRAHFAADERQVVTASLDGSVRVWPISSGGVEPGVEVRRVDGAVDQLMLVGDAIVAKTATAVLRWREGEGLDTLFSWAAEPHGLGVGTVAPDASMVLTLRADNGLEVRRPAGPPLVLRGHTAPITHAVLAGDGHAYSSSIDGTLRRWDLATGVATVMIAGKAPIQGFAVAPDGRVAARVGEDAVMIAPDGTRKAFGDGPGWCIGGGEFEPSTGALVLRRCDQSLAIVSRGGAVRELPTGGFLPVRTVISPDGTALAGAMGDRTVRVWSTATGALLAVLRGHTDLVMDVAFSPDGKALASASYDKTVRVWDLASGRSRVLRGHDGAVDQVLWTRAGDAVVTGSRDGTIRRWRRPALAPPAAAEVEAVLAGATAATIDDRDRPTSSSGEGS